MRLAAGDQRKLVDEALKDFPSKRRSGMWVNAANRWAFLRDCRERFYAVTGRREAVAPSAAAGQPSKPATGITATDCNAWLATLPPVPLHGEEP